jgi:PKD repeat protein
MTHMTKYITHVLVLMTAVLAASCTMTDTKAPPLMGPSEMSLALTMTASPDTLSLDGFSQTLIAVEARDTNGQLVPNVPLRVEILADGVEVDYGTISARTLVTNSNGRATVTYTAPSCCSDSIPTLQIGMTPTGTDASTHVRRVVELRLMAPGFIGTAPTASFTVNTRNPAAFTTVRFDGSASTAGLGAFITSYVWDFGDGTSGTGVTATHQYNAPGTYFPRLTVTNSSGFSDSQRGVRVDNDDLPIEVTDGQPPTAAFTSSPEAPDTCTSVFFNAAGSTAGPGHRIVSYNWSWGDGTPAGSGSTRSHKFTKAGGWVVVLTVTDEAGQKGTTNTTVTVIDGPDPCGP